MTNIEPVVTDNNNTVNLTMDGIQSGNNFKNTAFSKFIMELNIGHLIPLNCGHNGHYNQQEIDMYSYLLLKSKFIN